MFRWSYHGRSSAIGLLFLGLFAAGAGADEPPRLYTNEDLARLGPTPAVTVQAPLAPIDPREWEFVADFIERERRHLAAREAVDLERARIAEAEREREEALHRERFDLPLGFFLVGPVHRPRPRPTPPGARAPGPARIPDIRPLHARPSPALEHRAEAIGRSGADAFPVRGPAR